MKRKRKIKVSSIIIYVVLLIMALSCLLPMMNAIAISFSNADEVVAGHVGIIPVKFTLSAYRKILKEAQLWRSFLISIIRVILGTGINLFLVITMAYPLSKSKREFHSQGLYIKIALFCMLFNGGLVPTFLVVKNLQLLNTIWALVLPGAVGIGNVILLMNFFRSVPKSLEEAAAMDGANPLQILWNVFLPASKPCIATIILFCMVGHWNDYFTGILYMTKVKYYPLQSYIQGVTGVFNFATITDPKKIKEYMELCDKTINSAKIVISVVPLMVVYPVLQQYFTEGIVVGAVKE